MVHIQCRVFSNWFKETSIGLGDMRVYIVKHYKLVYRLLFIIPIPVITGLLKGNTSFKYFYFVFLHKLQDRY